MAFIHVIAPGHTDICIEHKKSTATIVLSQHGIYLSYHWHESTFLWFIDIFDLQFKTVLIDVTINNGAII